MPIDKNNRKSYILLMDAEKITKELMRIGLKQVEIAKYLKCSQSTVSDLSRGEIKNPSIKIGLPLIELAQKNGIDLEAQ